MSQYQVGDLIKSDIIHFREPEYYEIHRNYSAGLAFRTGIILKIESKEKFEQEFRQHKRGGRIFREVVVRWSDGNTSCVGSNTLQKVQSACKKW